VRRLVFVLYSDRDLATFQQAAERLRR
jgi:hypothetical protein